MSDMTIRVYRVTPDGERVELSAARHVPYATPSEIRNALTWPPCACRQCSCPHRHAHQLRAATTAQ